MAPHQNTSLLKRARDLLRVTPSSNRTKTLAAAAERFQECWDIIKVSCSHDACIEFVGAATHLIVALDVVGASPEPTPPKSDAARETKCSNFELDRSANIA